MDKTAVYLQIDNSNTLWFHIWIGLYSVVNL